MLGRLLLPNLQLVLQRGTQSAVSVVRALQPCTFHNEQVQMQNNNNLFPNVEPLAL